jgi:hypothetical protein
MPKHITIGDKRLCIGNKVRSTERAAENGICSADMILTVHQFKGDGELLVGLYSERRLGGWGDLDGAVPSKQGFWATRDVILDNFELISNDYIITGNESFKGKNLKNMRCKILHVDRRSGATFVELDKNVGGGSADGSGRRGHCVVVSQKSLVKKKQSKDEQAENWFIEEENHA